MQTKIAEVAEGIYRLCTFVPEIAPPAGFTFNQFLVLGDGPALMHGPTFEGDGGAALHALADEYDRRILASLPAADMPLAA